MSFNNAVLFPEVIPQPVNISERGKKTVEKKKKEREREAEGQ